MSARVFLRCGGHAFCPQILWQLIPRILRCGRSPVTLSQKSSSPLRRCWRLFPIGARRQSSSTTSLHPLTTRAAKQSSLSANPHRGSSLATMLFSYAVSQLYVESCSMFVRGGVYRVVKEAMGGALAKFSVSALMFDYVLTGPISGVSAGQYLAGLLNELLAYGHLRLVSECHAPSETSPSLPRSISGGKTSRESRIERKSAVDHAVDYGNGGRTDRLVQLHAARSRGTFTSSPIPRNIVMSKHSLGWLTGRILQIFPLVAVLIGLGHSVLAMSGAESLAQVYREIEHPKLRKPEESGFRNFHLQHGLHFAGFVLCRDDHSR